MSLFPITAYDKAVWEKELKDFLPDQLFDAHAHIWIDYMKAKAGDSHGKVSWPLLVAKDNSIEDLRETYRLMFPGKTVHALVFAGSNGNLPVWNEYIRESAQKAGYDALYFSNPSESADELEAKIRAGGFVGIKSYLDQSPSYIPSNEIRIFDFFPKHQLRKLDELGGIVMLHIPRAGRLKDPVNLMQILEIKKEFPRLKLIIAHIGRAYTAEDIGNSFEILSEAPDLLFDFTANCCEAAIEAALKHVGPSRLLFGTDMPILRMRTHRIEENGTYVNLVPPGLYGDVSDDPHMREVSPEEAERITFFAYEELLAFKRAATTLGLSKDDVEKVMYRNAVNLIAEARRSIFG